MEDQTKVEETGNGVEEQIVAPEQSLASKMASENAIAQADEAEQAKLPDAIVLDITEDLDITSLDAFMESTKAAKQEGAVKTPGGFTLTIRSLDPGELAILVASPLFSGLIEQVKVTGKPVAPDNDDVIKMMGDSTFMNGIKSIVCLGVTSIPFVNKPEAECAPGEVPIDRLPFVDRMVVFKGIIELSTGIGGVEQFRYFQVEDASE